MQIQISPEEQAFLKELLQRDYQDLREEIYKTEDHTFKRGLREKEKIIESLLAKLKAEELVKTA